MNSNLETPNGLQSKIYKILNKCIDGADVWTSLINNKLEILVGPQEDRQVQRSDVLRICNILKKSPGSVQTAFFKTIINSWATTCRMQESPKLPCIFGCLDCKDELDHYLTCPTLWTLAASSTPLPLVFLELGPRERLCMFNTTQDGLKILAAVYRGYHTLKLSRRATIDHAIVSKDWVPIYLCFIECCGDASRHS